MQTSRARILKNELVAQDVMEIWVSAPAVAKAFRPGQFVMLRSYDMGGGYLGRPFAIAGASAEGGIRVFYKVIGKGTAQIASLLEGAQVGIVGPLGNGFDLGAAAGGSALLVGGGMGITPLIPLAQRLKENDVACALVVGAANVSSLLGLESFEAMRIPVRIATDDGSAGVKGYPVELVEKALDEEPYRVIYACGPTPLIKSVAPFAARRGIPMQVSLEKRMACGFGACTACACKTRGTDGAVVMKRVCKEGPVFDVREVELDG